MLRPIAFAICKRCRQYSRGTRGAWDKVEFAFEAESHEMRGDIGKVLRASCTFGADTNQIRFPAQMLDLALPPTQGPQALFAVPDVWLGAMVPKRWARRAVTRNTIKRQIYTVGATFEARLPQAAHVVRLRTAFDRKQFVSATSDQLKQAVRAELLQLFGYAARRAGGAGAASPAQQQGGVAEPVVPC